MPVLCMPTMPVYNHPPSHQPHGCRSAFWHKQAQLEAEYRRMLVLRFGKYFVTGTKVLSLSSIQ